MVDTYAIQSKKGLPYVAARAPRHLSFIESPEDTIAYFNEVRSQFDQERNVQFDLTNVESLSVDSLAMLIGCIKNFDINKGKLIGISDPEQKDPQKLLREFNVFQKITDSDKIKGNFESMPMQCFSGTYVNNYVARELTRRVSSSLFGKKLKKKEFYEIMIGTMANTKNHASGDEDSPKGDEDSPKPWYVLFHHNGKKNCFEFVLLDFGVGIFESWPVKQYIRKVPSYLRHLFPPAGQIESHMRTKQLNHLFEKMCTGRIKSRTGLTTRGRELPLIVKHARSPHFSKMVLVTNDGHMDLKKSKVICTNESFQGTLLFLEIRQNDD